MRRESTCTYGAARKDGLSLLKDGGKSKSKRLYDAGQKVRVPDMEEALFNWIINLHHYSLHIYHAMVHAQANVLSATPDLKSEKLTH